MVIAAETAGDMDLAPSVENSPAGAVSERKAGQLKMGSSPQCGTVILIGDHSQPTGWSRILFRLPCAFTLTNDGCLTLPVTIDTVSVLTLGPTVS